MKENSRTFFLSGKDGLRNEMASLSQHVKQDKWGQMPETGTFPKGGRNRKLVSCQNRWRVDMYTSDRQDSETLQGTDQVSLRLSLRLRGKVPRGAPAIWFQTFLCAGAIAVVGKESHVAACQWAQS